MQLKTYLSGVNATKVIVIVLFSLISVATSMSLIVRGEKNYEAGKYTHYNNYLIFKYSFEHLKEGKDLYTKYKDQHLDLYKYTPGFAVFFGIFYYLPDSIGMISWNLLNSLVLLFSIFYLPQLSDKNKIVILFIVLFELVTSLLNVQSNALITGLIIFSFGLLERKQFFWAVSLIVFASFIKIFSVVAFAMFVFYPNKLKHFAYGVFWLVFWLVVPLLFINLETYNDLIISYFRMLQNEVPTNETFSFHRLIEVFFGLYIDKLIFSTLGGLLLLLPLIKTKAYQFYKFRVQYLVGILMWMVAFNYRAESPTFIIAVSGILVWFVVQSKSWFTVSLLILTLILTTLSLTDLVPPNIRAEFVRPYALKAIPVSMIWLINTFQLLIIKNESILNGKQ